MNSIRLLSVLQLLLSGGAAWAEPSQILNADSVELVRGHEVQGRADLFVDHARFRYLFSSEENRKEFQRRPARYEIQMGGACARMGPLSGDGRTSLYGVHGGRIYIFASETCRTTFLKDPDKLLERPDVAPSGSKDAEKQGRSLLEKAVDAIGGARAVDGVRNFQRITLKKVNAGGKVYDNRHALTIQFPDDIREEECWDKSCYIYVATNAGAWYEGSNDQQALHAQQAIALRKHKQNRELLVVLRARNRPGTLVFHQGPASFEYDGRTTAVERVAVAFDGATCVLSIEPKTGRILSQVYRDRGPTMAFVDVEKIFTEVVEAGGLRLPDKPVMRIEGRVKAAQPDDVVEVRIDAQLDKGLFARPPA